MFRIHFIFVLLFSISVLSNGQCPPESLIKTKNWIKNGEFDEGVEHMKSDYKFIYEFWDENTSQDGQYTIMLNPWYADQTYSACKSWNGKENSMLVVNGNDKKGAVIWSQKIDELPLNKDFTFSFFVSAVNLKGTSPVSMDVYFNEQKVGQLEYTVGKTCNWNFYEYAWNSKNSKSVEIKLINMYYGNSGNDFLLDGLSMYECEKNTNEDLMASLNDILKFKDKPKVIALVEPKTFKEKIKEAAVKQTTITLENIFFDFGKSTLKEESFKELDELYTFMSENKDKKIEISGHTDNVGKANENLILSRNRARNVEIFCEL